MSKSAKTTSERLEGLSESFARLDRFFDKPPEVKALLDRAIRIAEALDAAGVAMAERAEVAVTCEHHDRKLRTNMMVVGLRAALCKDCRKIVDAWQKGAYTYTPN